MRTPQTLLSYEATRKPLVADLVARVSTLTDQEINDAAVLPWIRAALREKRELVRYQMKLEHVSDSLTIIDSTVEDPMGSIQTWAGEAEWVSINGRGELQVNRGELVWLPDTGGVWIDTIFITKPNEAFYQKLSFVQQGTKSQYTAMRKDKIMRAAINPQVIDLTGSNPKAVTNPHIGALAALGVQFSKG